MNEYNCLIVDDIYMNRFLLKEIVGGLCHTITEADNGQKAIDILQSKKIDIVFMDIEMPVMNGLETTKFIRNRLPSPLCNLPIIAITAYNPEDFFDDYKDAGFSHMLTKPYSFNKIQKIVREITI